MTSILTDLRSSVRILSKNPGSATAGILVLALGIGLSTAMFSIIYGFMYRPLPFEDGHRLYHLEKAHARFWHFVSTRDYLEWKRQQTSFEELSAFAMTHVYLSDGQTAERYQGARISADAFAQLRVRPILGRYITEDDDRPGAEPVVVLGHRVWQEQFGGDAAVVGRSLLVDGRPTTVVGVMPQHFRFPIFQDVWTPLQADPAREDWSEGQGGKTLLLEVFGRLSDGVTIDQARLEMGLIDQRVAETDPDETRTAGVVIKPYTHAYMEGAEGALPALAFSAVVFVLLIACANVANLLLARTAARSKELAVRKALGASRARVIAQVLTESFCLALPAAAVGLLLAQAGLIWFNNALVGGRWPTWADVRIDAASLAVVLAVTGLSALAAGLVPALRASRIDAQAVLKSDTRGSGLKIGRLSKSLVMTEIALSSVLLIGAGLLVRSIVYMTSIDFEFTAERVLTAKLDLLDATYPDDESRLRFWARLDEELCGIPGVEHTSFTSLIPGAFASGRQRYAAAEKSYADKEDRPWARYAVISPGFFETVGVAPLAGRDFTHQDTSALGGVVIVNRSFAEREWPGTSALGQRLRVARPDAEVDDMLTVVGVVPDLHMDGFRNRTRAGLYFPLAQRLRRQMAIMLHTSDQEGKTPSVAGAMRERLRSVDAGLPIYAVTDLEELLFTETFFNRVVAVIFSVFGLAALLLAAVGLYAVMAFSVSRRTAEVGVRMALGAAARDVLRLVVGQGLRQMAVGVTVGMLLAFGVTRFLAGQLVGVGTLDVVTFASITVLLVGVGVVASLVPALRASRVDPVCALRYD